MAWIESHDEIGEHPKTFILAAELGVRVAEAVGLLHLLWHFTLRFAWRDGDLKRFGETAIARASKWHGEPSLFIKALRNAGFLDRFKVHDWLHFSGKLVQDRLRYEKANIERSNSGGIPVETNRKPIGTTSDSVANITLPTLPDLTLPNQPTNNNNEVASLFETATAAERELAAVGYQKPDPKVDPEKALSCAYREIRKMPKKGWAKWDAENLETLRPIFRQLIEVCGSLARAYECMNDKAADFIAANYKHWTIRGIVKNAPLWIENHPREDNYGPDDSEGISVPDAESERAREADRLRTKHAASKILNRVRNLPSVQSGNKASEPDRGSPDAEGSERVFADSVEEKNPGIQNGKPGPLR